MSQGRVLLGVSSTLSAFGKGSELFSFSHSSSTLKGGTNDGDDPQKQTSFGLSPKFGYFISNNLALGLDLSLVTTKDEFSGTGYSETDKSSILAAGPFARYYILSGRIYPFLEGSCLFGSLNEKYTSSPGGSESYKTGISAIGGGIGFAAPLGDKVTFDVMLVYYSYTAKDKDDNPNNLKYVTGIFGIKLGFLVFPGSKTE